MTPIVWRFDLIALVVLVPALAAGVLTHKRELAARARTLLGLLVVVTAAMALGRPGVAVFALLVAVLGALEFAKVGRLPWPFGLAAVLVGFGIPVLGLVPWGVALLLWALALALGAAVPRSVMASPWCATVLSAGVLGIGLGFVARLASLSVGAVVLLVLLLQFNEGFGYAFGGKIGRHRPFPGLSPGKSLEGYAVGLLGAALATVLLASLDPVLRGGAWPDLIVLVVLTTAAANAGDLLLSRFKRGAQQKDFGQLLPGHGGVLDRFDGWLLAAPTLYVLCVVLPVLGVGR